MAPARLPEEAADALRHFRAFYDELFALKQMLRAGDWSAVVGEGVLPGPIEEQVPRAVQLRLRRAIAAQGLGGPPAAGAAAGIDPGYVMVAVADEVLLHEVAWPGLERWAETPLEHILYKSRIAGDRVFQAIDTLAARPDPDREGTAMTILLALEMGFRGRYYGTDDHGRIADHKERLFALIFHARYAPGEDPGDLLAGAAEPMAGYVPARLPQVRPWSLAIVAVVAAYLLVTWVIWAGQVGDIVAAARRIVDTAPLLR